MRQSKFIVSYLFLLLGITGCKNRIQDKLYTKITNDCGGHNTSNCIIKLADVTDFKWDKVYLFTSWTTADSISGKIGFKYNGDDIYDDTQRILFTNGNKTVYEEDIDYLNGSKKILFDDSKETGFDTKRYFKPQEAVFEVTRNKHDEWGDYDLTPLKTNSNSTY